MIYIQTFEHQRYITWPWLHTWWSD